MTGCMVGWAHTPFGKLDDEDTESLIVRVAREAVADAGIGFEDVDEIVLGQYNNGFDPQGFPSSLALQADPALRFTRTTHVENACATGTAAIYQGLRSLEAKQARFVLAIGVEKMTAAERTRIPEILLSGSYVKEEAGIEGGFAGIFAQVARAYFQRFGEQGDAMARIAAKNHRNGSVNPYAHMRKDLGFDFCRAVSDKNPMVCDPLRRTDCSMVSDGAAAVVLTDTATALGRKKAVIFRAAQQVNDFLPMSRRDVVLYEGPERAFRQAYEEAGVSVSDLDFAEVHDCFTIAELMIYEAMGLTPKGEGARAIDEGWTQKDGRLPVNPSGGLKAKGHPIGATGVSMHVVAAQQLTDSADAMQVPGVELGAVFNMGGSGVANYTSLLERLR